MKVSSGKTALIFSALIFIVFLNLASAQIREEIFDNGNYIVEWEANFQTSEVIFNITVQTVGFVGFGLSTNGAGMSGADIMIGGVYSNGTAYIADYYATSNGAPILDSSSQDWKILNASENETSTNILVSRLFNTCDNDDVPIKNDTLHILWSYGETDEIKYHNAHRGISATNMLDPPLPPLDISELEIWTVKHKMVMPEDDTTYWCTVHEKPVFTELNYIVGFSPNLLTPEALNHTHHFNIFECTAPEGEDPESYFGSFVGHPGQNCYDWSGDLPILHCQSFMYVWAVGGKAMMFPEFVGYPMVDSVNSKAYVMMEIHYNNPQGMGGLEFEVGANVYYTNKKRTFDAGLLLLGHGLVPSHIIPPKSTHWTTVGHCPASCLSQRIPEEGINIFNVLLHSHLSGRQVRVRHFRDDRELPWLANDENYSFDYQQNRPLRKEVKILQNDHLSYECVTDTTWKNGITLAGLSTHHEMCEAFLWYYPKQNFILCESIYGNFEKVFGMFGVQNWTYDVDYFDPTVTAPEELSNKLLSTVLDEFGWTEQFKSELQEELRYRNHESLCLGPNDEDGNPGEPVATGYPYFEEAYAPPDSCI